MAALLALPPEILHNVLKAVDPQDLATLPRCCRALQTFISGNRQLFKELYLQRLASPTDKASLSQLISAQDEPPRSVKDAEPDWEEGLHTLVSLQTILASYRDEKKGLIAMACNGDSDLNILKYKTHFRFAARAVVEFYWKLRHTQYWVIVMSSQEMIDCLTFFTLKQWAIDFPTV